MIKQDVGLKRNIIDKFYTSCEAVKLCIDVFTKKINILNNDLIIEPSAGNGAFIKEIKEITTNYLFFDIEPEHEEIIKQDYLNWNDNIKEYSNIHIIGNPPFGRQSSSAIKFIKKSASFADTISFILPRSFKKDSMKKYFPLNFHLIYELELPQNSFIINEKEYDVPCIFQIWKKKNIEREKIKIEKPKNFYFVKQTENPDISFRRVGVYAGKIDTDINKSVQSHYFIKFDDCIDIKNIILKLCQIKFITNNTTGPKSISKQELIREFNKIL